MFDTNRGAPTPPIPFGGTGPIARKLPGRVVDLDDGPLGNEGAPDLLGVGIPRGTLEKDDRRLTQEPGARPEHQHRDKKACDRVEAVPPGREDEASGNCRRTERRDVREDMEEGAAHVEALLAGPRKHHARGEAHRNTSEGHSQDEPAAHVVRVDEAVHG